jgi:hypothetical protein
MIGGKAFFVSTVMPCFAVTVLIMLHASAGLADQNNPQVGKGPAVAKAEQAGAVQQQEEKGKKWPWTDPANGKLIASPTAFLNEKGSFGFNFSNYVFWPNFPYLFNFFDFSYGITGNFEISSNMILPIGFLGFGLYPKAGFVFGKYVRLGFMADFGFSWRINDDVTWIIAGGSPLLLTIGNEDYHMNLSIHFLLFRGYRDTCTFGEDHCLEEEGIANHFLVFSSIGAGIRIVKHLKFTFDFLYIAAPKWEQLRHIFIPMAGLKVLGRKWYFAINAILQFAYGDGQGSHHKWSGLLALPMISFGWVYP